MLRMGEWRKRSGEKNNWKDCQHRHKRRDKRTEEKEKKMGEQKLIKETNENRYIEDYEGNKRGNQKSQNQKEFMLVTIHRSMEPNKLF